MTEDADVDLVVRVANKDDLDELMKLAVHGCDENGFLNPDMGKIASEFWPALNGDHGICAVIGKKDGPIEGMVLLRIGQMWYSDQTVVEEKAIFIYPEFRSAKGGRAARLVEFSKKVADKLDLPLLIGVLSNSRTEAKIRLYTRKLGPPSGAFFLYKAKTGQFEAKAG